MNEPEPLGQALATFRDRYPAGHRMRRAAEAMLRAHRTNQQRRAGVLAHPDLAERLTKPPLGLARPSQWNGYIPPAMCPEDDGELLRVYDVSRDGTLKARFNRGGRRSAGTKPNHSPQREALLEISAEAWRREHGMPAAIDDTSPLQKIT